MSGCNRYLQRKSEELPPESAMKLKWEEETREFRGQVFLNLLFCLCKIQSDGVSNEKFRCKLLTFLKRIVHEPSVSEGYRWIRQRSNCWPFLEGPTEQRQERQACPPWGLPSASPAPPWLWEATVTEGLLWNVECQHCLIYLYILVIAGCVISHCESTTCHQKDGYWPVPTDTHTCLGVSRHLAPCEALGLGRCVCHLPSDGR